MIPAKCKKSTKLSLLKITRTSRLRDLHDNFNTETGSETDIKTMESNIEFHVKRPANIFKGNKFSKKAFAHKLEIQVNETQGQTDTNIKHWAIMITYKKRIRPFFNASLFRLGGVLAFRVD